MVLYLFLLWCRTKIQSWNIFTPLSKISNNRWEECIPEFKELCFVPGCSVLKFFLSIDRLFSLSWESQSALVHSYDILWRRWRAVDKMSITLRSWRLPCGRERRRSQRWEPLRNRRSVDPILQLLFAVHDNKLFVLYVGFYTQLGQLKKLQIERDGAVRALRHHLVSSDTSELPEEGKQDLLARC